MTPERPRSETGPVKADQLRLIGQFAFFRSAQELRNILAGPESKAAEAGVAADRAPETAYERN